MLKYSCRMLLWHIMDKGFVKIRFCSTMLMWMRHVIQINVLISKPKLAELGRSLVYNMPHQQPRTVLKLDEMASEHSSYITNLGGVRNEGKTSIYTIFTFIFRPQCSHFFHDQVNLEKIIYLGTLDAFSFSALRISAEKNAIVRASFVRPITYVNVRYKFVSKGRPALH